MQMLGNEESGKGRSEPASVILCREQRKALAASRGSFTAQLVPRHGQVVPEGTL